MDPKTEGCCFAGSVVVVALLACPVISVFLTTGYRGQGERLKTLLVL